MFGFMRGWTGKSNTGEQTGGVSTAEVGYFEDRPLSHKAKRAERKEGKGSKRSESDDTLMSGKQRASQDQGRILEVPELDAGFDMVGKRKELEEMRQRLAESEDQLVDIQKKVESQRRRLERVLAERDDLRQAVEGKDDELMRCKTQLSQQDRVFRVFAARSQVEATALEERIRRRDQEAKTSLAEVADIRGHLASALKLLENRTQELKGAQAFLTKADSLSGADVIALVEALNAEIFQLAAFMADSFEMSRMMSHAGEDRKAAAQRVKGCLGLRLTDFLTCLAHLEDPTVLQIALQCYLTSCSKEFIELWSFDRSHSMIIKLYESVREAEDQAVGGRWRALSRSHLRALTIGNKDIVSELRGHIFSGLTDILVSADCRLGQREVLETMYSKFGERVDGIIKAALDLNQIIGEEITSSDMEVVTFQGGHLFDPALMDDAGGEVSSRERDVVLCTTELGLKRQAKEAKGGQMDTTLLLKPKVALESAVAHCSDLGKANER